MVAITVVKTIGTTGTFSTPQLWEDGSPADLTTAEKSAATTFLVATFVQGENLTFVGSGATGKLLDTDSTGPGTGSYITYGITAGNPAAADVVTGTSTATCVLTSGTPDNVGVIWQGQCQNQEFTSAAVILIISGETTSTTAYMHIKTVAGASFRDNANAQNNALRYNASNGCGLRVTGDAEVIQVFSANTLIENLQLSGQGTKAPVYTISSNPSIKNLILESQSTTEGVLKQDSAVGLIIANSVFILRASGGAEIILLSEACNLYNCTFVAPDDLATAPTAIVQVVAATTVNLQNCGLFAGDSTKSILGGIGAATFTTCYSDISGTAGVTQTTYGNEFQSVNDATRDFRLKVGAAQVNTGTTDATNAATDIVGTARPYAGIYDVGAWELVYTIINPVLIGGGFDAIVYNVRTVGT